MATSLGWTYVGLIGGVLLGTQATAHALGCTTLPGGTVRCELPVTHDSIVAAAHRDNNHGGEPHMWVKVGNGINRAFERIDISALAGRSDILSATLRHYIYKVGDGVTSQFAVHAVDDSWVTTFEEGSDRFQTWGYCSEPDWRRTPVETGAPGVTYNCPVDPDPNDADTSDCPVIWGAGFPGFLATPLDTTQRPASPPSCGSSRDCVANGGDPRSCWDTFDFDVTAFIQAEAAASKATTDVMIKRHPESGAGGVWWFSTEGAVCVLGATDPPLEALRPVLIVDLAGAPVPTLGTIPDPCS